ncbi:hypothetical protein B0H10DRAFT_2229346 [Mycena sp. CBHHK59/15]|nr:hypothetical protein B0H10DRAFT_2229346 [Mycena sp. CBHHK59/15]
MSVGEAKGVSNLGPLARPEPRKGALHYAPAQPYGAQHLRGPEPHNPCIHPASTLSDLFADVGIPRITKKELSLAAALQGVSEEVILDQTNELAAQTGRIRKLGLKPEQDRGSWEDVFVYRIDAQKSIRVFPGDSNPESGMFFVDFWDPTRKQAINTPLGHKLEIMAPLDLRGPMVSVEVSFPDDPEAIR